jgi:hypothetical protein
MRTICRRAIGATHTHSMVGAKPRGVLPSFDRDAEDTGVVEALSDTRARVDGR